MRDDALLREHVQSRYALADRGSHPSHGHCGRELPLCRPVRVRHRRAHHARPGPQREHVPSSFPRGHIPEGGSMTAQILSIKPPTLNALVTQTKAAWDRADQKQADADDWARRTGKLLLELKRRTKEEGVRWLPV